MYMYIIHNIPSSKLHNMYHVYAQVDLITLDEFILHVYQNLKHILHNYVHVQTSTSHKPSFLYKINLFTDLTGNYKYVCIVHALYTCMCTCTCPHTVLLCPWYKVAWITPVYTRRQIQLIYWGRYMFIHKKIVYTRRHMLRFGLILCTSESWVYTCTCQGGYTLR